MSRRNPSGRHRSEERTKTPLDLIAKAVNHNAASVGRRSAVIVATSGLAFSMGMPGASATKSTEGDGAKSANLVLDPTQSPNAPVAEHQLGESPVVLNEQPTPQSTLEVSVPEDLQVDLAGAAVTSVTPPPEPEPEPVVVQARSPRSNSGATSGNAGGSAAGATGPKAEAAPPAAAPAGSRAQVLSIAARYSGVPYRWGGTTPSGFDCSGYVQYVFKQIGVSLPRTSGAQASAGTRVSAAEARPGDLVYKPGHVGIYAGNGMMYDAPRSGKPVGKRKIWFTPTYIRVLR